MMNKIQTDLIAFLLMAVLLMTTPVFAHIPDVEEPENYVPTLGWISSIEGDVVIMNMDEEEMELGEGDPIRGDCIIETGEDGCITFSLEDYQYHSSILKVDYDSWIEFELSSGKHYDDTISHKWYIDPHQIKVNMQRGHLYATIITDNEEYDLGIQTANAEVNIPVNISHFENVDFFLSVEVSEEHYEQDMNNQMQEAFDQLAQITDEKVDAETTEDLAEMIKEYSDLIDDSQLQGVDIEGSDIITRLEVFSGEVSFYSDTEVGSSDYKTVVEGESYIVEGLKSPLKSNEEQKFRK